jgi:hemerythrin
MEPPQTWDDDLEGGDEELDREHNLQLTLVRALTSALRQDQPAVARCVAEQLHSYSGAHFAGEELLMEAGSYALLATHRQEHQNLLAHMTELRALVTSGERELATVMALDLRSELGAHMATSDRRFTELSERPRDVQ